METKKVREHKKTFTQATGIRLGKKLLWNVENCPFPVLNVPTLNLLIRERTDSMGESGTILDILEKYYGAHVVKAYLELIPQVPILREQEGEMTNDYWRYDAISDETQETSYQ